MPEGPPSSNPSAKLFQLNIPELSLPPGSSFSWALTGDCGVGQDAVPEAHGDHHVVALQVGEAGASCGHKPRYHTLLKDLRNRRPGRH
jgi:hypothetical protein